MYTMNKIQLTHTLQPIYILYIYINKSKTKVILAVVILNMSEEKKKTAETRDLIFHVVWDLHMKSSTKTIENYHLKMCL